MFSGTTPPTRARSASCSSRFIYKHLSKTAGTLASNIVLELGPSFVFVPDKMPLTAFHAEPDDWVVGSVRSVCGLYFSLWGYMPSKACSFARDKEQHRRCDDALRRTTAPHALPQWLSSASIAADGPGMMSAEFWRSYLGPPSCFSFEHGWERVGGHPHCSAERVSRDLLDLGRGALWSPVDCWVRQEAYLQDFEECVEAFLRRRCSHAQDHVLMERELANMSATIRNVDAAFQAGHAKVGGLVHLKAHDRHKNDSLKCVDAFAPHAVAEEGGESAWQLVQRLDGALLNMTGCCSAH